MAERAFAGWVEPIAAQHRRDDVEVLEFARSLPEEAWAQPSGLDGWTCKDVMSHIGNGNDQLYQQLLRQVIAGDKVDTSIFRDVDTDAENATGVAERRNLSPAGVIAEFEEAGEEVLDLLARLTDEHEHLRQDDPPFVLKGFMDMVGKESHSIEHLKQLKQALEGSMADRAYASWVEPIASKDRESRTELLELVRTLSAEDWERPSPLEGWTLKDLLAHLAGGTGKNFQTILEAVVGRQPVDPSVLADVDAKNRQDVEDRKDSSVGELLSEIQGESQAIDLLLARLTEEDKDLRQGDIPMSLGEGLSQDPGGHYREHLAHFKETLKGQD